MILEANSIQKGQLGVPGFPTAGNPGLPIPDSNSIMVMTQNARLARKRAGLGFVEWGPIADTGNYATAGFPLPGNPGLPLSGNDVVTNFVARRQLRTKRLGFVERAVGGNKNRKLGAMNIMTVIPGAGMRLPQAAFGMAGLGTPMPVGPDGSGGTLYYDSDTDSYFSVIDAAAPGSAGGTDVVYSGGSATQSNTPAPSSAGISLTTADASNIADMIQKGLMAVNAQQIFQANLTRAQNGLPLINPALANPVAAGQLMSFQSAIVPLGIIGALLIFAGQSGRGSKRR